MQVEYISRVCLASGRTTQDERNFSICHCLLRKIVIYDKGMTSRVTEIFTDCRSGKRCIIPEGSRICSRSRHNYSIIHGTLFLQGVHKGCYGRSLLAYGYIYAEHRLAGLICRTLIDDCVDCNGSLAGLTVADYKLSLSPADRNHCINSLQTCLKRFCHRLSENDSGSFPFKRHLHEVSSNPTFSVKRLTKRIHHPSYHLVGNIYRCDPAGPLYGHSFLYPVGGTKEDCADIIFFEVHHNCLDSILELKQFTCLSIQQSVNPDHTVTDLKNLSDLLETKVQIKLLELRQQHVRNFTWAYLICHILSNYSIVIIHQSVPDLAELSGNTCIHTQVTNLKHKASDQ